MKQSIAAIVTVVMLGIGSFAMAQTVEEVPFARLNIVNYHLHSQILEQPMLVEIALPLSYNPYDDRSYPVMYLTDGMYDFPMMGSLNVRQSLAYGAPIPEIITVGIDFLELGDEREFKRLDYYTPVEADDEDFGWVGGKADRFIRFINHELKPFVNTALKVDTDREVFAGHSSGGLLSLYMLFTQPETFDGYISASPSVYWADEVIYDYEEDYFHGGSTAPKVLFMSVGMNEDPDGIVVDYVSRMAKRIRTRHHAHLDFKMKKFPGESHMSVVAPAFTEGIRFVFKLWD